MPGTKTKTGSLTHPDKKVWGIGRLQVSALIPDGNATSDPRTKLRCGNGRTFEVIAVLVTVVAENDFA